MSRHKVIFYWDGELEPFAIQDNDLDDRPLRLPEVAQVISVRQVDVDLDMPTAPIAATVLSIGFELIYKVHEPEDGSIFDPGDNGVLSHTVTLVKR